MQRKRISWTELAAEFDMTHADKQWCLEEAIDIVKDAAAGGAENLPELLQELYEKLKELGKDAWGDAPRTKTHEKELS